MTGSEVGSYVSGSVTHDSGRILVDVVAEARPRFRVAGILPAVQTRLMCAMKQPASPWRTWMYSTSG
jgi:hypothetical protein